MDRRLAALVVVSGLSLVACGGTPVARSRTTSGVVRGSRCEGALAALRELDAVRQARAAGDDLAAVLRSSRAILAHRQDERSPAVAELFAEVEADAEARVAAGVRLARVVAEDAWAVQRDLGPLRERCAKPSIRLVKSCEAFAQIDRATRWEDARAVAAFADDLEALVRSAPSELPRPSIDGVRRLALRLRETAGDRARALSVNDAAARAERRAAEVLGACADAPSRALPLVVAKDTSPRALTVIVSAHTPVALASQFEWAAAHTDHADLAAFYRGVAIGRFGSGFSVVAAGEDGSRETYVVTNRHVVDFAERVELRLEDGTSVAADPVYIDAGYDLAVLVPREGGLIAKSGGFDVALRAPKDGEPVVATGYPGMLGAPSFQLSKGHVSNENVVLPDGTSLAHVQHTAAIDPGSSGGPLLGERREVLGVNTFKLLGRENVNMAVPASAVLRAVSAAREGRRCDGACRARAADDACLALASELRTAEPRLRVLQRMLGRELVASRGVESHNMILRFEPEIFARLRSSPVATLSEAVARRLAADVGAAGGVHPLEVCASMRAAGPRDADLSRGTLTLADGSKRGLSLRWEASRWVLADFAFTPDEASTPARDDKSHTQKPAQKQAPKPAQKKDRSK